MSQFYSPGYVLDFILPKYLRSVKPSGSNTFKPGRLVCECGFYLRHKGISPFVLFLRARKTIRQIMVRVSKLIVTLFGP